MVLFVLWLVQLRTSDAGIVDVGWTGCLGILAVLYAISNGFLSPRRSLIMLMAGIWSARLAIYLLRDRIIGRPEDSRYRNLRARLGSRAPVWFLAFFLAQAVLAWFFAFAFWLSMRREGPLDLYDAVAFVVWLIAITGESFADAQLARFRQDPANKGKTCRVGLWNYSRHPNYFFEWLHWWTYVCVAWTAPYGWLTLLGPALMLLFLFKVTGIPLTEAQALISRGDDYRRYQQTTSMFIPWFPKKPRDE